MADRDVLLAEYVHNERTVHVAALHCERRGDLAGALRAVAAAAAAFAPPDTVVVDVYVAMPPDAPGSSDALSADVHELLAEVPMPGTVRRVAIIAYTSGRTVARHT